MHDESTIPDWGQVQPAPGNRRLPIYLLIDTSESMKGAPIEAVRLGLEQFQQEVSENSFARDVVVMGVILFSEEARLVGNKLLPISAFRPSTLNLVAAGRTRLDLAFNVLLSSMERDVIKAVEEVQRADWRPVVFILTDARPTDENGYESDELWPDARKSVVDRPKGQIKPGCIVTFGCGPNVDDATLKDISTGPAFRIEQDEASFIALFRYITQSILNSVRPGGNPHDPFANITLPADLLHRVGEESSS